MNTKPACGPERDPDFFAEIDQLFAKYPEAADRYAVKCRRLEVDVLKIDFSKQVGVRRVEDGRIVTEFLDRDKAERLSTGCCEWPRTDDGLCNELCQV